MDATNGLMEYLRKVPWGMIRGFAQLLAKICLHMLAGGRCCLQIFGTTINLNKLYNVLQMLIQICDTMILLTAREIRNLDWTEFMKNID